MQFAIVIWQELCRNPEVKTKVTGGKLIPIILNLNDKVLMYLKPEQSVEAYLLGYLRLIPVNVIKTLEITYLHHEDLS